MATATRAKTKLPRFQGKLLIEVPNVIPSTNFLEGDFGKAVDEKIKGRYGDISAVNIIKYKDNIVKGSTPFYVVAVNEVIREEGLRTATPADLERVLKFKALPLRGQYEDSALVLRSEDKPNKYLARDLMKQVKARNPKQEMPVMIPLCGLELIKDSDSEHGLTFKLREDSEIIYTPILNEKSAHFSSEDIDAKIGLPIELGEGDRYFYTRDSGLSGLDLGRDLGLDSGWYDLAYSDDDGRVVVVSGEATSQKFVDEINKNYEGKFVDEINKNYEGKLVELNKRKERALRVLDGKE